MRNPLRWRCYLFVVLFAPLAQAGIVTVNFSGSEAGQTFSGQFEYDSGIQACLSCNIQLAGPFTFTDSNLGGFTLTSTSAAPVALFSFVNDFDGGQVVSIDFNTHDPMFGNGFDVTGGPNAVVLSFSSQTSIGLSFPLPQPGPTTFPPFFFPFPDLTEAQSVSFGLTIFLGIFDVNLFGDTTNVTFSTAAPEPATLALMLTSVMLIAIHRLRRTFSIL